MVTIKAIPAEFQFDYDLESLKAIWPKLHTIDMEIAPAAESLWLAWLDFHNGHYDQAYERGMALDAAGFYVAHLAANTYGAYFLPKDAQPEYFDTLIQHSQEVAERHPDHININYVYAMHLGRYAQSLSPVKAVSSGAVLHFKNAVEHCLSLHAEHTPSLLAYAALMGEAIGFMGELPAKMTFGATRKKITHFYDQALALPTPLPVVYLEAAKGLARLEKRKNKDRITSLLLQAVNAPKLDPLDVLDIREAEELLETF